MTNIFQYFRHLQLICQRHDFQSRLILIIWDLMVQILIAIMEEIEFYSVIQWHIDMRHSVTPGGISFH